MAHQYHYGMMQGGMHMMGPPMGMRPPGMPQQVPAAQPPPMGGLSEEKLQVWIIFL